LEQDGYTDCRRFSCHGTGQAVAQFALDNGIPIGGNAPAKHKRNLLSSSKSIARCTTRLCAANHRSKRDH